MPTAATLTTNFATAERIVLLIDLSPLLHRPLNHLQPAQNPYITAVLSAANLLLTFPDLSHSLSSFKLFFSSLSPLLSSSTLPTTTTSLSFNHPYQTLTSLSQTLTSPHLNRLSVPGSVPRPKLSHLSSSIAQVIHDYPWDLCSNLALNRVDVSHSLGVVRSNLVVLFSPVCQSFHDLSHFIGNDDLLNGNIDDIGLFCGEFRKVLGGLRDAFVSRDIHLSWIDVRYEVEDCLGEDYGRIFELFRNEVKGLGWGFCSSDSIVLGSALVPFGLIYHMIGVSSNNGYDFGGREGKKLIGQLCLEILDNSGKPLECKYCDLQLINVKRLDGRKLSEIQFGRDSSDVGADVCGEISGIREQFKDGVVKIDVKGLCKRNDLLEVEEQISDVVLACDWTESRRKKGGLSQDFFADKVLDLISEGTTVSVKRKCPPLWQILLSFLYRRGFSALVSLSNADGSTTVGVLKPLTINLAFLFVLKNNAEGSELDLTRLNLGHYNSDTREIVAESDVGMDAVSGSLGTKCRRKQKKLQHRYKELSWSSFCKAVSEGYEMALEEAYISQGCDTSKKLKFLKCWMKQILKNRLPLSFKSDMAVSQGKLEKRVSQSNQESEPPLPCLVGEDILKKPLQTQHATPSPEAAEAFFSDLSGRIQHGIESGVDLVALAQRIVCSCIYWLRRNVGSHINDESQASIEKSDSSCTGGRSVGDLIKILLVDPKDVARKHNESNLPSKVPNPKLSENSPGDKIRQFELQILFRMEILLSELAFEIRESTKNKFVKQICSLLEFIQCSMEDGFFGDFNMNDYVGRTISSRYKQNLGGIVHRIYEQMDLLLFDDEDESPNLLLNSEDSNQSWRIGDNDKGSEPNSTEESLSGPPRDYKQSQKETQIACQERKLVVAQERRERALRLSSFTRRAMPDLQRVWAPKPPKLSRSKSESFHRSKRKSRRESYDTVCETPMSRFQKCVSPSEDSAGYQEASPSSSTMRALFKEEPTFHHD